METDLGHYHGVVPQDRPARYAELARDWQALMEPSRGWLSNAANFCALIHHGLGLWWTGFYLVDRTEDFLKLGPFQGQVACTGIPKGRGVCGKAWVEAAPVLVGDVRLFEDHIACSSLSRSELVLPLWYGKETVGVLDMDSTEPDYFNTDDIVALQPLLDMLQSCWEGI